MSQNKNIMIQVIASEASSGEAIVENPLENLEDISHQPKRSTRVRNPRIFRKITLNTSMCFFFLLKTHLSDVAIGFIE